VSSQGNAFARALALQQAGDFEQAERLYEQILRIDPQQASVWHHLGLVVHRSGRLDQASECISRAVSLDASNAIFHGDLGTIWHQLGRFDEAIDCFQQAVELAPEHAQAHYSLGLVLKERGNQVGAKLRFQQAVRLHPEFAEAWNELGILHQVLGETGEASACFSRLISLVPDMAGGHFNLGNLRLGENRLVEAAACYVRALELEPRFPEALNNLGTALHRLGRIEQARHAYEAAIAMNPNFVDARSNLGALWSLLGRHGEAETSYREALALNSRSVAALTNLAGVLQAQMRLDDAEQFLRQALALEPLAVNVLGNLANVLAIEGRVEEAAGYYRQALDVQFNPVLKIHAALLLPPIYQSNDELRQFRETFEANVSQLHQDGLSLDPLREAAPVNFLLAYQGFDDCELARRVAGLYQRHPQRTADPLREPATVAAPHFSTKPAGESRLAPAGAGPHTDDVASPSRVRIGFASKFLRDHSIGDLTKGLIHQLSRRDFHVTVFLAGDSADETVSSLRQHADECIALPEDVPLARQIIADADLDVLVYPEIGMDPLCHALAFARLAPVQCALWGHPVTTGIPTINHFISSALIEPADAGEDYTENLVRLESLPTYYYRPQLKPGVHEPRSAVGVTGAERQTACREFGLSHAAHLYLCPQSLFKCHPDFDLPLAAILKRDPQARIVLVEAPHRNWTQLLSQRLKQSLKEHFSRVSFVPRVDRQAFLRLLTTADVILDPLHFGGGNTSFQALGLGLPIVTLPAKYMRGRVTAGCYRKMNFDVCVARDAEDYANLAVRLGTDPAFNAFVRSEISSRSSVLFEDLAAVRELEAFFKSAAVLVSRDRDAEQIVRTG